VLGRFRPVAQTLAELYRRRFTPEEVQRLGYGRAPDNDRVALELEQKLGRNALTGTPGFWQGNDGVHLFEPKGGLSAVPVRSVAGKIYALRIRTDDPNRKWIWWSYPAVEGVLRPAFKALVHVPLHTEDMRNGTVILTEGEVKADLTTLRTGVLCISIPGVSQWSLALPVLKELGAKRVVLAFDTDARRKKGVAGALQRCAAALSGEGYQAAVAVWDETAGKGIDDVLTNPIAGPWAIELHEGQDAWEKIAELVASSGAKPDPAAQVPVLLERLASAEDPKSVAFGKDFLRVVCMLDAAGRAKIRDEVKEHVSPIKEWDAAFREALNHHIEASFPEWYKELTRNKDGRVESNTANATLVLVNHEQWQEILAFNELTLQAECQKPPPWDATEMPAGGATAGHWIDEYYTYLSNWLQRHAGITLPKGQIKDVVSVVARRRAYHPVRDWLSGLKWDGKPRLENWFQTYLGAPKEKEQYLSRIGKWSLMGAVARAMEPGCQLDYVTTLIGDQGLCKSKVIRALSPDPKWVMVHDLRLDNKDALQNLRGKWLVELAEIDSMSGYRHSQVRSFVTCSTDTYRKSYGDLSGDYPRQCIFFATGNEAEFLHDSTGGRRWWPFDTGRVDIDALIRDRDQLWAEAYHRYQAGERYWPTPEEEQELFAGEQEARRVADAWEGAIADYLARPRSVDRFITTELLLTQVIKKDLKDCGRPDTTRVGQIMSRLKWVVRESKAPGHPRRFYEPKAPPSQPPAGKEEEVGTHDAAENTASSQPSQPSQPNIHMHMGYDTGNTYTASPHAEPVRVPKPGCEVGKVGMDASDPPAKATRPGQAACEVTATCCNTPLLADGSCEVCGQYPERVVAEI
jgi:predicted P-loop ATPase